MTLADKIQIVIAVCTAAAAVAAWIAAKDSKRAAQAGLFSQLMAEYGSPEMGDALRELTAWHKGGQPGFQATFRPIHAPSFQENLEGWARSTASLHPSEEALKLHQYRRRITYFFSVVDRLVREGELGGGFARDLQELTGTNVLCTIVLPMEEAFRNARGDAKPDDGGARILTRLKQTFCQPSD